MCYNVRLYKALLYYYNWMFTNLEIFDKRKSKRNPKIQKKNILGEGFFGCYA